MAFWPRFCQFSLLNISLCINQAFTGVLGLKRAMSIHRSRKLLVCFTDLTTHSSSTVIKPYIVHFFSHVCDEGQLLDFVNGRYLNILIHLEKTKYVRNVLFLYVRHF